MAAKKQFHIAYLIGQDPSVTRAAFYSLRGYKKLVVRHYRIDEHDLRDIERATGDLYRVLGPFHSTGDKHVWAVQIQVAGFNSGSMMEVALAEWERAFNAGHDVRLYYTDEVEGRRAVDSIVRRRGLVFRGVNRAPRTQ